MPNTVIPQAFKHITLSRDNGESGFGGNYYISLILHLSLHPTHWLWTIGVRDIIQTKISQGFHVWQHPLSFQPTWGNLLAILTRTFYPDKLQVLSMVLKNHSVNWCSCCAAALLSSWSFLFSVRSWLTSSSSCSDRCCSAAKRRSSWATLSCKTMGSWAMLLLSPDLLTWQLCTRFTLLTQILCICSNTAIKWTWTGLTSTVQGLSKVSVIREHQPGRRGWMWRPAVLMRERQWPRLCVECIPTLLDGLCCSVDQTHPLLIHIQPSTCTGYLITPSTLYSRFLFYSRIKPFAVKESYISHIKSIISKSVKWECFNLFSQW